MPPSHRYPPSLRSWEMTQFWYLLVLAEILRWENSWAESSDCQVLGSLEVQAGM